MKKIIFLLVIVILIQFSGAALARNIESNNEIIVAVYSDNQYARDYFKKMLNDAGFTVCVFDQDSLQQLEEILKMFENPQYNPSTGYLQGNRIIPSYLVMIRTTSWFEPGWNLNFGYQGYGPNIQTGTVHLNMTIDFIIAANGESYTWVTEGSDTDVSAQINSPYGSGGQQGGYNYDTSGAARDALDNDDIRYEISNIPNLILANYYPGHIPHPPQANPQNNWGDQENNNYSGSNNSNNNYQQYNQNYQNSGNNDSVSQKNFDNINNLEQITLGEKFIIEITGAVYYSAVLFDPNGSKIYNQLKKEIDPAGRTLTFHRDLFSYSGGQPIGLDLLVRYQNGTEREINLYFLP